MDKSLILKEIKKHYKFKTDGDFANFLGVSNQVLSNWKSRNTYDAELIYTKCLNINPEWLLTGKGLMLKENRDVIKMQPQVERGAHLIPLYDGIMTASLMAQELPALKEPAEMINAGDWFRDATAAMRVHGDSMYPNYVSGSIVAMKEVYNKRLVVFGQDYMVETTEYRVLKRLQRSDNKQYYLACSTNLEIWEVGPQKGKLIHEPFDIHLNDIIKLYQILGSVKRNHSTKVINIE